MSQHINQRQGESRADYVLRVFVCGLYCKGAISPAELDEVVQRVQQMGGLTAARVYLKL